MEPRHAVVLDWPERAGVRRSCGRRGDAVRRNVGSRRTGRRRLVTDLDAALARAKQRGAAR